ncbi:MAG: glycosyltransferase family 9 protein [Deltaproteobacteria bacterium]|nr:glycosyltransferase family 9 protein [Deltaproteobacteria bacterium]
MKILIVKLSAIGDVVQTLYALDILRRALPEAQIDWLVEEAPSNLLLDHPMINKVIVVKKKGWLSSPRENLEVVKELRSTNYDMALDFQGLFKSGLWIYLSGAKKRIGFSNARELSYIFLNEKLPPSDIERHAVERYLTLARYAVKSTGARVGLPTLSLNCPLYFGLKESSGVEALLQEGGISGTEEFFIINPFARWSTKVWPLENAAEFIKMAKRELNMRAVVIGSKNEAKEAEELLRESGVEALNLAGKTTLKGLTALISRARFVLTVDSGPMHMTAGLGVPQVAIFGPTSHIRTGPYGFEDSTIRREMSCAPCFKRVCPKPECMSEVTAKDAFDAVQQCLLQNKDRGSKADRSISDEQRDELTNAEERGPWLH